MILFIGAEDRGFFVKETAALKGEELCFVGSAPLIETQINEILGCPCQYLIVDIEQYIDPAEDLAEEFKRIGRAKNCEIIIYAPGYDQQSRVIEACVSKGIRYYVFSGNQAEAREELERCFLGYYPEEPREKPESGGKEEIKRGTKIGVTGACSRIGTTTLTIQLLKYLQVKGYKACYIEVNGTGFVEKHEQFFHTSHDQGLGKVTFQHVEMFYRQENLPEVLKQDYDFYLFDFGTYTAGGFHKTSFLEKDMRIFVMGSKASEMEPAMEVLRNEYYTEVSYIFNFISENEKPDLLEFMEEKATDTYFSVYTPDQFEYVHNPAFEKLLPVDDHSENIKKKGLLRRLIKRGNYK